MKTLAGIQSKSSRLGSFLILPLLTLASLRDWLWDLSAIDFGREFGYKLLPRGSLAQLAEQLTLNQRVVGSNPTRSTTKLNLKRTFRSAFFAAKGQFDTNLDTNPSFVLYFTWLTESVSQRSLVSKIDRYEIQKHTSSAVPLAGFVTKLNESQMSSVHMFVRRCVHSEIRSGREHHDWMETTESSVVPTNAKAAHSQTLGFRQGLIRSYANLKFQHHRCTRSARSASMQNRLTTFQI